MCSSSLPVKIPPVRIQTQSQTGCRNPNHILAQEQKPWKPSAFLPQSLQIYGKGKPEIREHAIIKNLVTTKISQKITVTQIVLQWVRTKIQAVPMVFSQWAVVVEWEKPRQKLEHCGSKLVGVLLSGSFLCLSTIFWSHLNLWYKNTNKLLNNFQKASEI